MARKDALVRLHEQLRRRRDELYKSIAEELGDLRRERGGRTGGDDGDAAAEALNTELNSRLAQIESRELKQIHRALVRLENGTYGTCEGCGKKIPVARLNALPYTSLCIECQREMESNPEAMEEFHSAWQKVYDSEAAAAEINVNLSDLEYNLG
jgi:DnaK suppressor protein